MKRGLILVITLLLVSLTAYSQQGTVTLSRKVAIEVIKDLDRLDQSDSIIALLEERVSIQAKKITIYESIEANQNEEIENLKEQLAIQMAILETKDEETGYWKKQYKKQKGQKFIVGGIGIAVLAILFIAN